METRGPWSSWEKPKISLTSWVRMVWDSPLTALASSSGFREQERVPGALVLCPGHSKQNRVAGARLGSGGVQGWGVGSSRQRCGGPHGRTPSPAEPDEREGGAPAPPPSPLCLDTTSSLASSCSVGPGPEWGQRRVSTARLQTRARGGAGPSGGGASLTVGGWGGGRRQRPGAGNFRGRWGRRDQKPPSPPPPPHSSPVPVSSPTLPEIPSITHRRAKSRVLSSRLRSCLRS